MRFTLAFLLCSCVGLAIAQQFGQTSFPSSSGRFNGFGSFPRGNPFSFNTRPPPGRGRRPPPPGSFDGFRNQPTSFGFGRPSAPTRNKPVESFRSQTSSGGFGGDSNNGGGSGSGSRKGNHIYQGKNYLLTWRNGQNSFDYNGAAGYCRSQKMRIVSLDDSAKSSHFIGELRKDNAPYFWAGGRISGDARTLTWENGRSEGITKGRGSWSDKGQTGPQPEKGGECLAILNNVYQDGIRWHDVACHHKKPTICEET